jgi:hypothetical protein
MADPRRGTISELRLTDPAPVIAPEILADKTKRGVRELPWNCSPSSPNGPTPDWPSAPSGGAS